MQEALDGDSVPIVNEDLKQLLFDEVDTYHELSNQLQNVALDVVRTEYDALKAHAVCYHMAGMVDVVLSIKKALALLDTELKIMDVNVENEMDVHQVAKYRHLVKALKDLS